MKCQDTADENSFFLSGSKNKSGDTYLPLDPILTHTCNCDKVHTFRVGIEVEHTFYAVYIL